MSEITYSISKTPPSFDSDNVYFIKDGKPVGHGYRGKKSPKICMIRCPSCEKENYSPHVASGYCAWCGYNPNKQK